MKCAVVYFFNFLFSLCSCCHIAKQIIIIQLFIIIIIIIIVWIDNLIFTVSLIDEKPTLFK